MKPRRMIIFTIIAIVLQPLFLSLFPESMAPNLGFCILIVCAATLDEKNAIIPAIIVLVTSLFRDLFSNQYVGVVAISMLIVAITVTFVRRRLDLENPIILISFVILANILYEIIYWVIYRIMGTPYDILYVLKNIPLGIVVDVVIMFTGLFFAERYLGRLRRESYFKEMKW